MEEFKDIVDFLLQTPSEDSQLTDDDVQKALTTLSEILKTFNPQTLDTYNQCLQRTLNLINEKILVSEAAVKCSLLILNFLFSNNYHHYQRLFCPIALMQILLKLSNQDFLEMLQTHFKHVHETIVTALRCLTEQRDKSITVALQIIYKLAKSPSDQQLIRKYLTKDELITKLIPLLFIDNKEQRKLVINIIMAVTSTTFSFTTVTTVHIQVLKSGLLDEQLKYVKKIEGLLRLNDEDWHQIWCCVIRLLGLELHKGGPAYVNALLEVLEEAFKSSLNTTRISAFQCWQELILNFAIDIEELCTKKRIKLLLIPLKASNCKAELVALEKFKTWWLLLCKMSPRLFDFIDEALVPFLNFCFSLASSSHNSTNHNSHKKEENLYLGRRFPALLPHLIDALLQLIGHRAQNCKCNPRVVQGNFIDLNRDNLSKISKIIIKAVSQATLLVAKSTELQKTVDCLWYSLLQIIRKDDTNGIREEFINNVLEIIDKLLAKNCIDVAAIIFEQTILEKAWLFTSLDHEIQYTQNMADKRKLIFSIKKPVVLYNFINVLLEGESGDSSVDMVNNNLLNVNFLLTLSENEVYNFFLLLNTVIIRLPRVIKTFLRTPIEYLRREPNVSPMLNKWIELYRSFFCDNDDYPPEITVDFCVYLETVTVTKNIDVLIGNILNICIPKLNSTSVPNICIEKVLKILIRLIENERCLVLNSFNKLLKVFYKNYGALSIIFKSLSNFLKYQQNYDDFFNVLSTIGDIIAKVSTDAHSLTLILSSLISFENQQSANERANVFMGEETIEMKTQIANLIKKCKLKLKPEYPKLLNNRSANELKPENPKLQNNRSAKMVAMSTTETIPVITPTKEIKLMEKIIIKPVEKTMEPLKIVETPRLSQIKPAEKTMEPLKIVETPRLSQIKPVEKTMQPLKFTTTPKLVQIKPVEKIMAPLKPVETPRLSQIKPVEKTMERLKPVETQRLSQIEPVEKTMEPLKPVETPRLSQISVIPQEKLMEKPVVKPVESNETAKPIENKKIVESPIQNLNNSDTAMSPPSPMSPPGILNMDKLGPILRRLPRILPKPPNDNTLKKSPSKEFVVINSNWKFNPQNMSEKQIEKMKERGKDIPALYQDLSQSNSQDLFKPFEPDENLKENVTQNLTFQNAITTENIVAKIQPPPIPTVPVTEPDKKRTRRRTVSRVPRTNDSSIPSTSNTSEINPNIAPILENLLPKIGDGTKLKAERELKKLQIDCTRTLTVMGTAEKKTLRSRELNAIPLVSASTPGNEPVKKRGRRISVKIISPQVENEIPQEESEEVIESSQESSKLTKITNSKTILEEKSETSPKLKKIVAEKPAVKQSSTPTVAEKPAEKQNSTPIVAEKPYQKHNSTPIVVEKPSEKQSPDKTDKIVTSDENVQKPDERVQIDSENSPKTESPNDNVVNKLQSIIENNFSEIQTASNSTISDSIPTTAEVMESRVEESVVFDKETESVTDDFVEDAPTNASFVEYKNADNSVLATSMMSSPNPYAEEDRQSNDLEKTQEFLNSTLNISPIKNNTESTKDETFPSTAAEIPAVKETQSPELMFSDEEEKHQVPEVPAVGSEFLIDFNQVQQSPSSRRKLHRARGRSAQLLNLLPDSGDTENIEMGQEIIKSHFKNNNLLTFEKELPSPLAKPSSSIMKGNKRKQPFDSDGASGESDSPKCKRKRVSFHDPPVSCEKQYVPDIQRNSKLRLSANKVFKKSQKSLLDLFKGPLYPQQVPEIIDSSQETHPNVPASDATISNADQQMNDEIRKSLENERIDKDFGELSKVDYLIEPPTESQGSVDNDPTPETLNNIGPFFPELVNCTESIDTIFMDLTSPLWATSLKTVFDERKIYTIGHFAALSELELNRLPLREHKINNSRMALSKYLNKRKDAEKMEVNQSTEEAVTVRRGVKRKRRFSFSLLEKDRQEMTLEAKKEQLESIFDNCSDPNEISTLLSMAMLKYGTNFQPNEISTLLSMVMLKNGTNFQLNEMSTLLNMFILKADTETVLKIIGQRESSNKTLELILKHLISTIGGDQTYGKCISTLKNLTGIDYTADTDDVQDASITSMTNTSTVSESEENILNTTKKCVEMISSTAETVFERFTTLIQTASANTTPTDSKKSK